MMIRKQCFLLRAITVSVVLSFNTKVYSQNSDLTGPYLGQDLPGNKAELFAPDIIKTGLNTRDIALTPDGQELYFSTNNENHSYSTIYVSKIDNGVWTKPVIADFAKDDQYRFGEPFIAPDGKKMYFISTQPIGNSTKRDYNIWVMNRVGNKWGNPQPLGAPVNTELNEFFPSVTKTGTVYFTRTIPSDGTYIFRSKLVNNKYSEPEKLGNKVNSTRDQYNAFISPDEDYLIVPNGQRTDGHGGTDYYVCFRNMDDSWSGPFNLGNQVNSAYGKEWSSYVSPDGKYLFFMSDRGPNYDGKSRIFWIDASLIEALRPKK